MNKSQRLGILALLIATAAFAQEPQSSPPPAGPLAQALQPFVDHRIINGVVVLVADKDKILELEAVGYQSLAKKTPMKTNDLFWIASMSKSVTATAFMMLVDEGKVKLDDPVEKYLPQFKGQVVVDPKDPTHTPHPAQHPIRIREILSHTSGIRLVGDYTPAQRARNDDVSLQRSVDDFAEAPLRQQPFTKFEYNNAGIDTAGRIIEVVSGMSYADFVQKRLLDPLGMKDTTWWPNQEQGARLARSVKFTPDKKDIMEYADDAPKALVDKLKAKYLGNNPDMVPPNVLSAMTFHEIFVYGFHCASPAGGLFTTAGDLAKFCQMVLNGGVYQGKRYLSEKAVKEMSSVQTGNIIPSDRDAYGLGWAVKRTKDGYPSPGSFGHRGAASTHMWIDPAMQRVFIVMVQRGDWPAKEQDALNNAFLKTAIEKYGAGSSAPRDQ